MAKSRPQTTNHLSYQPALTLTVANKATAPDLELASGIQGSASGLDRSSGSQTSFLCAWCPVVGRDEAFRLLTAPWRGRVGCPPQVLADPLLPHLPFQLTTTAPFGSEYLGLVLRIISQYEPSLARPLEAAGPGVPATARLPGSPSPSEEKLSALVVPAVRDPTKHRPPHHPSKCSLATSSPPSSPFTCTISSLSPRLALRTGIRRRSSGTQSCSPLYIINPPGTTNT